VPVVYTLLERLRRLDAAEMGGEEAAAGAVVAC